MKNIILVLFVFLQWSSNQTSNIVGKWSYCKFESSEKIDNKGRTMIDNSMSKFSIEFRNDATYYSNLGFMKETGTWKANTDFIITTSGGISEKIKYIQKHKDTLRIIEEEDGLNIVFKRIK